MVVVTRLCSTKKKGNLTLLNQDILWLATQQYCAEEHFVKMDVEPGKERY